jgi:ribosome-associated heat shock protein Hsp15
VRVDKWLWAVRLYKSRTQATDACKEGRVKSDEITLKPSSDIKMGQTLRIRKRGLTFSYQVVELLSKRVGADLAIKAYKDLTPQEIKDKYNTNRQMSSSFYTHRPKGLGRPTKKDRRKVDEIESIAEYGNFEEE